MEIKRTAEIFVETRRRLLVCSPDGAAEQRFCPDCRELMLTAEQAARFFQINCRSVY